MNRLISLAAVALCSLLAACGGGGSSVADKPLPIDEASPKAYTDYLDAHPEALIQPEHLLIVKLDPKAPDGRVSARLFVRQSTTVAVSIPAEALQLATVDIEDASGSRRLHHQRGEDAATATLLPGAHRIVFRMDAQAQAEGKVRTIFLKLADTPEDAARRVADVSAAATAAPRERLSAGLQSTPAAKVPVPAALGTAHSACEKCNMNGADLSNQDFTLVDLMGSSLIQATFDKTQFVETFCGGCALWGVNVTDGGDAGGTTFRGAYLYQAVIREANFWMVDFRGADLNAVTIDIATGFYFCNFGADPTWGIAHLANANLTGAYFLASTDQGGSFQGADFSGSSVSASTFAKVTLPTAYRGTRFDNMTGPLFAPATNFSGFDFSGTSFVGIDLHAQDFSVAGGVILSDTTEIAKAVLSDGTTGINLAGRAFPVGYAGFAGTVADETSGKQMSGVNLSNVSLLGADLTRVRLNNANLHGAVLTNAILYGANLTGVQGGGAADDPTVRPVSLVNAYMVKAVLDNADLTSADLSGVRLYGNASLVGTQLGGSLLNKAVMADAVLTNAYLVDATLTGASLVNASLDNAKLTNAKLDSAYLQGADFSSAEDVTNMHLDNSSVSSAADAWPYTELDGSTYSYAYGVTKMPAAAKASTMICPSSDYGPCDTPAKLVPSQGGAYPPVPACVPVGPDWDNCP